MAKEYIHTSFEINVNDFPQDDFQKKVENGRSKIKSINLSGDEVIVTDEIPGVYCGGIQYYDLKNIDFINYAGMVNLIDFLKAQLEKGIEVRFVNVNEDIKNKIRSLGLEHVLTCV